MPLKGIPAIISPDLLHALSSAGHGDEIVLADVHFPTSSICRHGPKEIRADGHRIPPLLEAILKLFPLDAYVQHPVAVMDLVEDDKQRGLQVPVWETYQTLVKTVGENNILPINPYVPYHETSLERVERFEFYERAKKAFAIVHTGETAQYGNIIIKKGLIL